MSQGNHRLAISICGLVQGVGFRPFVFNLARERHLAGWISNNPHGVAIEVEGEATRVDEFLHHLETSLPPNAVIQSLESTVLDPIGYEKFEIRPSDETGEKVPFILPDIAVCQECLREMNDPSDRRFQYPFINCTHCGPRFSIVLGLPYDRVNTTMGTFTMCPTCRAEYEDPDNRRFHAQPIACPECGPHLTFLNRYGQSVAERGAALQASVDAIRAGRTVAVKGLGGFHLMADAANHDAVGELRRRKGRGSKPFALMFRDLGRVRRMCRVSDLEERLLRSPESPIVLLAKIDPDTPDQAAPENPNLGALLPYTPLHHLLLAEFGAPLIATSGNRSEEPICTTNEEGLERLAGIADGFLIHDRPIARHLDDSIAWVVAGRRQILRRARGYAPLPLITKKPLPSILAVGGHLKNSVALSKGNLLFPSQHIGDLDTLETVVAFEKVIGDLTSLYQIEATITAHDKHPDYASTAYAGKRPAKTDRISVQHHLAHVFACMVENELDGPVLGISWDGTGYGTDGTIWGGECFSVDRNGSHREFTLSPFRLPGSETAIREPRRSALGLIWQMNGGRLAATRNLECLSSFTGEELNILVQSLRNGINAPFTSSMGRLFDAVAAILNLCLVNQYEGEAAMKLEFAAAKSRDRDFYPINLTPGEGGHPGCFDWHPMLNEILDDLGSGVDRCDIAKRFHNTLGQVIVATARQIDIDSVVLTGGCFQNRLLTETAIDRLRRNGFRPYWHQRIPPNDGGIAVGQIIGAARELAQQPPRL